MAPIISGAQAAEKASFNEAINELDRAVVLELHSLSQNSDRWPGVIRQPSDGQQELILLRLDSCLAGGVFAKSQETTDLVAKFRKSFEIRAVVKVRHFYRRAIVSQYDIYM